MHPGGVEPHAAVGTSVVHPEGDIYPLDFLQVVGLGEGGRQQGLFEIVPFQRPDGILFAEPEGENIVRPQSAGELPRHHRGIAAIGAGGGGGGGIAQQLRPAGGAAVGPDGRSLRPPVPADAGGIPLGFCLLPGLGGLVLLLGVKSLNFRRLEAGAAVFAFQLAGGPHKPERPGAGRALIIGNLSRHSFPPFRLPWMGRTRPPVG